MVTLTRIGVRNSAQIPLGKLKIVHLDDAIITEPFVLRWESYDSPELEWQETFATSEAAHRALGQYAQQWRGTGHLVDAVDYFAN